jgi:hypothetical protein
VKGTIDKQNGQLSLFESILRSYRRQYEREFHTSNEDCRTASDRGLLSICVQANRETTGARATVDELTLAGDPNRSAE